MRNIKILYAEDSPTDVELVRRELKKDGLEHDCTVSADLDEITRLLKGGGFDLILSGFNLKSFDALAVLAKRAELAPAVPFIVVTGTLPDETAVELLRKGATDYVIKDRVSRLCPAIRRAMEEAAEKEKLEAARWEIKESEARYRELFESSSEFIFLVSLEGGITVSNPAFRAVLGYRQEELVSFKAERLVPESRKQDFVTAMATAAAGIRPGTIETVFVSASGKTFEVSGSFYPRTKAGKVVYIQAIFRDLTEQRVLEAQFRQAQKMDAVGRLAGGIAHDFNNILGAIEGYASLVLNTLKEDDPITPDLMEIRKAVARASSLTKQLLVFSRKQALQKKPCNPNSVVENIQKMIARLIGENIALQVDLEPGLPDLVADPGQLDQMLMNLAVNARDAMPDGGRMFIRTRAVTLRRDEIRSPDPQDAGCDFVAITVKDTGKGMTPEVMEHIFEPFFTTKEKGKGTGLGLSMVYGVMKQHNGWVTVDSELGKGTEFTAYLPAKPCGPVCQDKAVSGRFSRAAAKAKVLIVEDDTDLRNLAAKALSEYGHSVETAASGAEAAEKFRGQGGRFDIVFSDMVLGDMKAHQLVDEFLPINPAAQFIFTSGYLEEKATWDFINSKGYKFIPKPYSVDALLSLITEVLARKPI
jgi:hypothetical protein